MKIAFDYGIMNDDDDVNTIMNYLNSIRKSVQMPSTEDMRSADDFLVAIDATHFFQIDRTTLNGPDSSDELRNRIRYRVWIHDTLDINIDQARELVAKLKVGSISSRKSSWDLVESGY